MLHPSPLLIGDSTRLTWLYTRLVQHGLTVQHATSLPVSLPAHSHIWCDTAGMAHCLSAPQRLTQGVLLDISGDGKVLLEPREQTLLTAQVHYLDVDGLIAEPGVQAGFALAVGGSSPIVRALTPYFDILAPLPGAWLAAGPVGSATFCCTIVHALQQAYVEGLLPQALPETQAAWQHYLLRNHAHQHHYLSTLLLTAQHFLARPRCNEPEYVQSFAVTLARWLCDTLPLGLDIDRQIGTWLATILGAEDNTR